MNSDFLGTSCCNFVLHGSGYMVVLLEFMLLILKDNENEFMVECDDLN